MIESVGERPPYIFILEIYFLFISRFAHLGSCDESQSEIQSYWMVRLFAHADLFFGNCLFTISDWIGRGATVRVAKEVCTDERFAVV